MSARLETEFAFCTCQPGIESALKAEVAARIPSWKFAFSRPGFVTFKLPMPMAPQRFEPMRLTFARTIGLSYGRVEADEATPGPLAEKLWAHEATKALASPGTVALHVWSRDQDIPGENGIEPGRSEASLAALEAIRDAAPENALASDAADASRLALDVALVEPNQWWIGAHVLRSRTDR
ncbi:MAG: hypothetical protein AAF266_10560, partial [Planctomycetota bacterium]